jgi:hypothetical protein
MAPEVRVRPQEAKRFTELTDQMLEEFSRHLDQLPGPREPLERSGELVARSLLEWKWRYADGRLEHWGGADVEGYLLEFFPAQMPSEERLVADAPACAAAFLRFLERTDRLTGEPAEALAERCEALSGELERAARDPRRWGISKALATQMQAEGEDPSDSGAVQRWMADFNVRPFEEQRCRSSADRQASSTASTTRG